MRAFGSSPQEKAMGDLIHDHANGSSGVGHGINHALKALEKGDLERVKAMLDMASRGHKRANEALDAYYIKFKEDFPGAI